ncbi:MAG: hypothetical protein KME42_11965 [Tildeniella nuda ZEHNDER 1965/U140]|jgi:hypothetical protein|nr:hypothetical protein [Tildeniella nuda ZEHNDER 1965/U140]
MKHTLATTVLTVAMVPVVISTQAIANTATHSSPTDRSSAALQRPDSVTAGDKPAIGTNSPNSQIQLLKHSSSNVWSKPETDRLNRSYPAYCEFFLFNVEPGSWQFKQDIQRCVYGQ